MTLVILAAGMGSRYGGLKQIDPITENGEFILDFSVFDAIRSGFDKVVFVIKKENLEAFRDTVGKRFEDRIKVEYVFQSIDDLPEGFSVPEGRVKPWGTAHALLAARDVVTDPFAVINADDFYGESAYRMIAEHYGNNNGATGDYCMVGYTLKNTLTENGTVSRGICRADADGKLVDVTERTKIKRVGDVAESAEDSGTYTFPLDSIVSMNCWGFTPDVFADLEREFSDFLSDLGKDPLKAEFYLPAAVDAQQKSGVCDVKVYPTTSLWQGVTYPEDKERVKSAIRVLIDSGEYPEDLWA